jgi:hypothetical protein
MSPHEEHLTTFRDKFARVSLPLDVESRGTLEKVVRAYTDDRRAAGWPIEQVIIALKQEAMHARPPLPADFVRSRGVETALLLHNTIASLVTTCIKHYYTAQPGTSNDVNLVPGDSKLVALVRSWSKRRLRALLPAEDDRGAWPRLVPVYAR